MKIGIRHEATDADLPVEQPTKFELVINLKTAKQIGLTKKIVGFALLVLLAEGDGDRLTQ